MKREEEIITEAQKHGLNCMSHINYQDGFIDGAKWADKSFLERAYKWIEENIDLYAEVKINVKSGYPEIQLTNNFKENFIKAMKG